MVEAGAAIAATSEALKIAETLLQWVRAIVKARRERQELARQLCKLEGLVRETQARYQDKGPPATEVGRVMLDNVRKDVRDIELFIEKLTKEEPKLRKEMAKYEDLVKQGEMLT